jgi:pimeloyl-ACP methyl ester carboxylesterase
MDSSLLPTFATVRKKTIFRFIKVLLLIYCLLGIALYYLQGKLLFHPVAVGINESYQLNSPYREVNIPYSNTSNLNIIEFTTNATPKGVVLYFHGNRKNISYYAKFSTEFTRNDYEVWMMDYPGFGKSTGELDEKRIYDWCLQTYKLARKRFPPDSIIIFGKSMGSGFAAQLASVRDTRRLILETPYYSFPSIVGQYAPIYPLKQMIHFKVPTYQYLQKVTAPITIFHGTDDWIIRYQNAKKLLPFLKPTDEFITISGGSHNNLHEYKIFQQKVDSVLNR